MTARSYEFTITETDDGFIINDEDGVFFFTRDAAELAIADHCEKEGIAYTIAA